MDFHREGTLHLECPMNKQNLLDNNTTADLQSHRQTLSCAGLIACSITSCVLKKSDRLSVEIPFNT